MVAHTSSVLPAGAGPAHSCTRRPAARAAPASSGPTPTTRDAELPGRRVYVVNVSRSALSLGKVTDASPSHRATSAHCRSTSATGRPAASASLARRRSASTAASQGPRETAKSSRPSETAVGPGGSVSGSGVAPPGVTATQCGDRHASTGSRSPGSGTPGGRCTACAWNRTPAPVPPVSRTGAERATSRLPSDRVKYPNACGSERSSSSDGRSGTPPGSS
ncbi:hypothetical protein KBY46_01820 [Streptomyces sp. 404i]|nr:hypothetical protein [Streptomyces sp. 404i]MBQ1112163.1 hypothetical protein [Streptomyces sp. C3-3]